ncbi:unnamed protein product [Cladocopium goreaui]|uniref:C-type lectin domain-containing protein n=1 Tax=Cladocopium goreaui TaxID=2562237 RepID=A0A9P1DBL4_9DINO|nr:unnamed protein product [Cladocopium goreaui]
MEQWSSGAVSLRGRNFCWLGLQEFPNTESWRWLDASDNSYDSYWHWATGEPNNFGGRDESVAVMNFNLQDMDRNLTGRWADGLWYDLPARFSLGRAICEFEGTCKAGWDHFRDSCYQLQRWPGSFKEAQGHCQEASAHLVSISSAEEQDFVQRLCGSNMCWLGLEEASKSERWRWIDGSSLTFENWQQGEPNNYGGIDENRAMMNLNFAEVLKKAPKAWIRSQQAAAWQRAAAAAQESQEPKLGAGASWTDGKWYDVPMDFNLALPMCEAPTAEECQVGWQAFGGSCYKLIFHPSDFDIAEERCLEHNSFLVAIASLEENQFVQNLCGQHFCWIGLRRHQSSTRWSWIEGTELEFSNWQVGEPNNFNNVAEKVAIMNFNMQEYRRKEPLAWASGRWYDVNGALNLPKAICEKRKVAGICDTGWKAHEDSCYFKLTWHYNFDTSTLRCEDMGAELVSIGTLSEQIFVQHLCGQQMCWLGLQEHPLTEVWFWIDGTPLAYQNWQVGEPNNGQGDENRAVMNMNLNFEENIVHQEVREDHIAVALACGFLLLFVILLGRGAILHNRRRGFGGFVPSVEHDEDLLEQLAL